MRWVAEPYVEEGFHGERLEVRPGDEGRVVCDDSPIEFVVTFPEVLTFCPPRSCVELVDGET